MRVDEGDGRHADVDAGAFGQGTDLQRQIAQLVQRLQVIDGDRALAERIVDAALVLAHRGAGGLAEEFAVEQVDQDFLDEALQAEPDDLVVEQFGQHRRQPRRAWREVGQDLVGALGVLEGVAGLVEIRLQQGVDAVLGRGGGVHGVDSCLMFS